jgi:hypothetical protein
VQWRRGDAVLLCEANVPTDQLTAYFGARRDGPNVRAHLLFWFVLNTELWLALARRDAEPLVAALGGMPHIPDMAQWATFLRNHDELDLSRLTEERRNDVFSAFAPLEEVRLFGRGIRRDRRGQLLRARHVLRSVLAHRLDVPEGSMLLHNLRDEAVTANVGRSRASRAAFEVFSDGPYDPPTARLTGLELHGWGYRWIRLRRGRRDRAAWLRRRSRR